MSKPRGLVVLEGQRGFGSMLLRTMGHMMGTLSLVRRVDSTSFFPLT
jgi:hypothetical protein